MSQPTTSYTVSVPDASLQELKQRLAWAKPATQFESSAQDPWDFGVPAKEMMRLVTYWKDQFDWRKAEAQLNELPQYHTEIEVDGFDTLDIHCEYLGEYKSGCTELICVQLFIKLAL